MSGEPRVSGRPHAGSVDLLRLGRAYRAIRVHLDLRQGDVAARAGVSQQHVSDLELGRAGTMRLDDVDRLFRAIDARPVVTVVWRGGELDRLLDEGHAAAVSYVALRLREDGREVIPEATYSVFGERGSIDLLAWHPATRTLLIVEVKTEIASAEEMLRRHDAKVRLAPGIARERVGTAPASVARLLVVTATATNRRRVARLGALLDRVYPLRGPQLRAWLAAPTGAAGGLLFVDSVGRRAGSGASRSRRVVRRRRAGPGGG